MSPMVVQMIFFLVLILGVGKLHLEAADKNGIKVLNAWKEKIWIVAVSDSNSPVLEAKFTRFSLSAGDSQAMIIPVNWSGHVWAQTGCDSSSPTGCLTGDYGSGTFLPLDATTARFRARHGDYEVKVSAAAGFNLAVLVTVYSTSNQEVCAEYDRKSCPKELQVVNGRDGEIAGCRNGFEYNPDDQTISPFSITGTSANYRITFKAFCKSTNKENSPPSAENKMPHSDESAPHQIMKHSKNKNGSAAGKIIWKIILCVFGVAVFPTGYTLLKKKRMT